MNESTRRASQRARTRGAEGESDGEAPSTARDASDPFERVLARERDAADAPAKKRAVASEHDTETPPDEHTLAAEPEHTAVARRASEPQSEDTAHSARARENDATELATIAQVAPEPNTPLPNGDVLGESSTRANETSDVAELGATSASVEESTAELAASVTETAPTGDVAVDGPQAVSAETNELARAVTLARDAAPKSDAQHTAHAAIARAEALHSTAPLERATERATHAPLPTAQPENLQQAADILRQVRLQLTPDVQSAVIHLAPAELGRVSIELEVSKGEVHARVRAEQPEALGALQRHLPELRAALSRHGLEAQSFDLALGFQDGSRGREPHTDTRKPQRTTFASELAPVVTETVLPLARALAAGGVDTYA